MAKVKIYHLLRSGPRVVMRKPIKGGGFIPVELWDDYSLPNRYRTTDENGKRVILRFLADSPDIDQAVQIEKKFPANTPWSPRDREMVTFKNGILETDDEVLQRYLDSIPGNKAFKRNRDAYPVLFEEFVPELGRKKNTNMGYRQAQARVAAEVLTEEEMDIKLLKIYGPQYQLPTGDDADERRTEKLEALQDAINEIDETASALDIILETTETDTVDTLIGKAINAKVLSFINDPEQILIQRNGRWETLLRVSSEHTEEQKMSLFRDRLSASDGKALVNAIKQALIAVDVEVSEEETEDIVPEPPKPVVQIKEVEVIKEVPREMTDDELQAAYEKKFGKPTLPAGPNPSASPEPPASPAASAEEIKNASTTGKAADEKNKGKDSSEKGKDKT